MVPAINSRHEAVKRCESLSRGREDKVPRTFATGKAQNRTVVGEGFKVVRGRRTAAPSPPFSEHGSHCQTETGWRLETMHSPFPGFLSSFLLLPLHSRRRRVRTATSTSHLHPRLASRIETAQKKKRRREWVDGSSQEG